MFKESNERQEYFFSNLLLEEFAIINFGHEKCLPEHSFGPAIRDYYIMHYIIDGEGTFTDGHKTYKLSTGHFFIIKPDDLYAVYQADKENPWEYAWIGFEGTKAAKIVEKQLGFIGDNTVGKIKDSADKTNTDCSEHTHRLTPTVFEAGASWFIKHSFIPKHKVLHALHRLIAFYLSRVSHGTFIYCIYAKAILFPSSRILTAAL